MKFEIGEIAIALSNPISERGQPRTKGAFYPVLAICYCSKCGRQNINISGTSCKTMLYCSPCGHRQPSEGLWWTNSDLFTKPQFLTEEIEKAVGKEDYELAEILHKIKI